MKGEIDLISCNCEQVNEKDEMFLKISKLKKPKPKIGVAFINSVSFFWLKPLNKTKIYIFGVPSNEISEWISLIKNPKNTKETKNEFISNKNQQIFQISTSNSSYSSLSFNNSSLISERTWGTNTTKNSNYSNNNNSENNKDNSLPNPDIDPFGLLEAYNQANQVEDNNSDSNFVLCIQKENNKKINLNRVEFYFK